MTTKSSAMASRKCSTNNSTLLSSAKRVLCQRLSGLRANRIGMSECSIFHSAIEAGSLVIALGGDTDRAPHETLSDREFQVLRLIASGKTIGEIAALLNLSDKTISTYRARLLEKMRMRTSAELTHYAIMNKLVE